MLIKQMLSCIFDDFQGSRGGGAPAAAAAPEGSGFLSSHPLVSFSHPWDFQESALVFFRVILAARSGPGAGFSL